MSSREHSLDAGLDDTALPAPPVQLEPCTEFHADDASPWCAACGWTADEHEAVRPATVDA